MKKQQAKSRIAKAKNGVCKVFDHIEMKKKENASKALGIVQTGFGHCQEYIKNTTLQSIGKVGRGLFTRSYQMKVDADIFCPINPHRHIRRFYRLNLSLFSASPTAFSIGCIIFVE